MTGKALRRARLRAGLTQRQLAQLAGVTIVTVARCESGRHEATDLTWARLGRALEEAERRREAGPLTPDVVGLPSVT